MDILTMRDKAQAEGLRNRVVTRDERLAQTGDCPSLYPDNCPDLNTCPVHDDGTLFPDSPIKRVHDAATAEFQRQTDAWYRGSI